MTELLAHLVGDYFLQSDWMALNKTKANWPAFCHVIFYSLPFLLLDPSLLAILFIIGSHFAIDRWRLARYVCWIKNYLAEPVSSNPSFSECDITGYPKTRPDWLTVWLLIITDNTMHLLCNHFALNFWRP